MNGASEALTIILINVVAFNQVNTMYVAYVPGALTCFDNQNLQEVRTKWPTFLLLGKFFKCIWINPVTLEAWGTRTLDSTCRSRIRGVKC